MKVKDNIVSVHSVEACWGNGGMYIFNNFEL